MKVLCDTNIPGSLVAELGRRSNLSVAEISTLESPPITNRRKDQLAQQNADLFLTAIQRFLIMGSNYGVAHYHDPSARDDLVADKVENLRKNKNPWQNIAVSIP